MRVAIGSTNQTKIAAVIAAVDEFFPGVKHQYFWSDTPSGVKDQPWGINEIIDGAERRARFALTHHSADLSFGLEGGVLEPKSRSRWLIDIGIVYVLDKSKVDGLGTSRGVRLLKEEADGLLEGKELSEVVADLNSADTISTRDCSIIMTGGRLPAERYYREAVEIALENYRRELANASHKAL